MKKYFAELIATFLLVFVGAASIVADAAGGGAGLIGIAVAHGLILSIAVTATMNISGAHINPAVTLGALTIGKISAKDAIAYVVFQLLGAILAGFLVYTLFPSAAVEAAGVGTPRLGEGISPMNALALEVFATIILGLAIYGTAVSPKAPSGIGGFGIGLTVAALILAIGPFTGAAMNPARHIGTAIFAGDFLNIWIYTTGPAIGGVIAFRLGKYIFED